MILFYRNTKKSDVFDARETAPANATEDMFKDVPSDLGQLLLCFFNKQYCIKGCMTRAID